MKRDLTAERLREILSYDPLSGEFRWLVGKSNWIGGVAGALERGYVNIRVDGVMYRAHRLAFLYMTDEWPDLGVDHIDCVKNNNRWANLREANQSSNRANSRRSKINTSGFKGVSWFGRTRKWRAQIGVNSQNVHLGYFDDPQEAHAAYAAASLRYFGEFARDA